MVKKLSMIGAALAMGTIALVPMSPAEAQNRYRAERYDRDGYRDYRRGDNRYYSQRARDQRCDEGKGGTVIGAIAGGLIGNEVARRGDKTTGLLIGGVVGALAGREIDRAGNPGYCR